VIYWNIGEEREYTTREDETRVSKPFLLRYSNVFNLSQTEGIDLPESALQETRTNDPIEECERIVSGMPNMPAVEQSDKAWYAPSRDVVGMPSIGLFRSSEEYYSTFFHELTHSTGHKSRVGREGFESIQSFGSESYSREELVAEVGAAMLCGVTGIENRTIENSAAYLRTWIDRLKSDSRLIVGAASSAQRAADYILGHDGGVA
jgi:antirestriction protein ArdC